MRGEAALSASCFFCGEKWTKKNVLGSRSRNKTNPSGVNVEIVNAWEERCVVSTCRMLRIPPAHPAVAELLCTENYCAGCKQLMRDVEFSVGAIDKLQQQILNFRRMLLAKLESNLERLQAYRKDGSSNHTNSSQELFKFVIEKAHERPEKFSDDDSFLINGIDEEVKEEINSQLSVEEIEIKEEVCDEDNGELFFPADVFDEFVTIKDPLGNTSCDELNKLPEAEVENPELKIVPEEDVILQFENEDEQTESSLDEQSDSDPEWTINSEDEFEMLEVQAEEAEDVNIETHGEGELQAIDESPETSRRHRNSSRRKRNERKRSKLPGRKKKAVKTKCNQIKLCPHLTCKQQFLLFDALDTHIRNEHGEDDKLIQCDECEKKFALNCHLRSHKSIHRRQDWRKDKKRCEFCGVWLKSEEIEEHEERHRSREFPFSCLICDDSEDSRFLGVYHLTLHMREKHPTPDVHKCPHCEKTYTNSHKLRQHVIFVHEDPSKRFSCEQCKVAYTTAYKLKKHLDSGHIVPKKRKELICEKCGKISSTTSAFNIHLKTHSDTFPFKCKICDKCFKLDAQVKKHEEIHAGLQFQCPDCPKTFTTERYLKQHSRCHLPRELRKYYYKTKGPAADSVSTKDDS